MKDINKLVISGGAANVYYILGALDILYGNGKLNNIRDIPIAFSRLGSLDIFVLNQIFLP